jgi:cytochrome c5
MIVVLNMQRIYESRFRRNVLIVAALVAVTQILSACSMGEEMRRIDEAKRANQVRDSARTTNLNGAQLFVRSCNTCHPGGKEGMGPRLDKMDTDFPTDDGLKKFLRKGKGIMPAQPPSIINDNELNSLVVYLRALNTDLKESAKDSK